jgi:uncharacterized lipoprotein YmbA
MALPGALLVALLMTGGCSTTPASNYYVLERVTVPADSPLPPLTPVALGPVELPAYLERPQLVVRDQGRLRVKEFERWGEPLSDGVANRMTQGLSAATGVDVIPFLWPGGTGVAWRIPVEFIHFEADGSGRALLEARWAVFSPEREDTGVRGRARHETPVDTDDPLAITRALSELLGLLVGDIARSLRGVAVPASDPA